MDEQGRQAQWERLSREEKNQRLYLQQRTLLEAFYEKNAISREQYEKSLRVLTEKMGMTRPAGK